MHIIDSIEINDNDDLAAYAARLFSEHWLKDFWDKNHLRNTHSGKQHKTIHGCSFTLEDDHIELYNGYYTTQPETEYVSPYEGCYLTLYAITTIKVKDGRVRGKMCIRNPSKPTIITDYEIHLKEADVKMTDGLNLEKWKWKRFYHNCNYKFPIADISFTYQQDSKTESVFNKVTDLNKRKLLEQYILEYFMSGLCGLIKDHQRLLLKKQPFIDDFGGNLKYVIELKLHNERIQNAFETLSDQIISSASSLIYKNSKNFKLNKVFALVDNNFMRLDKIEEKQLKVYKGSLRGLNSLTLSQEEKYVIVSKKGDQVILNVPVTFKKLVFYGESMDSKAKVKSKYKFVEEYTTIDSYFILHLNKKSIDELEICLAEFKVGRIVPNEYTSTHLSWDYLVTSAIENRLRPFLELAVKEKEVQELAINPHFHIDVFAHLVANLSSDSDHDYDF